MRRKWLSFVLFVCLFVACGAPSEDEGRMLFDSDLKALASVEVPILSVSRDRRKCARPYCGGYWVQRVNQSQIKCADGRLADRCYASEMDWSALGFLPSQIAKFEKNPEEILVQANFHRKVYATGARLGILEVEKVWTRVVKASSSKPTERSFYVAPLRPIVICVKSPCPRPKGTFSLLNWKLDLPIRSIRWGKPPTFAIRDALRSGQLIVRANIQLRPKFGWSATLFPFEAFLLTKPSKGVECLEDIDCTKSIYRREVNKVDDCYCLLCPTPMGVITSVRRENQWHRLCSSREENEVCPVADCLPEIGRDTVCVQKMCQFESP